MDKSKTGALVITRRQGQTVFVGDNVKITIVSPTTARIRIEAPRDVPIEREELR